MLKTGYDHFELTKRPPKVDVCSRQYVFNQVPQVENAAFLANATCPPASVPTTLASAYYAYERTWNQDFIKAVAKYDREEADQIAANDARAEAEAKRAEREAEKAARIAANGGQSAAVPVLGLFSSGNPLKALTSNSASAAPPGASSPANAVETVPVTGQASTAPALGNAPVPTPNPAISPQTANAGQAPQTGQGNKPFWKIWSSN